MLFFSLLLNVHCVYCVWERVWGPLHQEEIKSTWVSNQEILGWNRRTAVNGNQWLQKTEKSLFRYNNLYLSFKLLDSTFALEANEFLLLQFNVSVDNWITLSKWDEARIQKDSDMLQVYHIPLKRENTLSIRFFNNGSFFDRCYVYEISLFANLTSNLSSTKYTVFNTKTFFANSSVSTNSSSSMHSSPQETRTTLKNHSKSYTTSEVETKREKDSKKYIVLLICISIVLLGCGCAVICLCLWRIYLSKASRKTKRKRNDVSSKTCDDTVKSVEQRMGSVKFVKIKGGDNSMVQQYPTTRSNDDDCVKTETSEVSFCEEEKFVYVVRKEEEEEEESPELLGGNLFGRTNGGPLHDEIDNDAPSPPPPPQPLLPPPPPPPIMSSVNINEHYREQFEMNPLMSKEKQQSNAL